MCSTLCFVLLSLRRADDSNLDLEPKGDISVWAHISTMPHQIDLCNSSKWRSGHVLQLLLQHLRAQTNLWGRYDWKTEKWAISLQCLIRSTRMIAQNEGLVMCFKIYIFLWFNPGIGIFYICLQMSLSSYSSCFSWPCVATSKDLRLRGRSLRNFTWWKSKCWSFAYRSE